MVYLLDANVLIALCDTKHTHHQRVQNWFHSQKPPAWATCPLTENAFLRIIGSRGYPIAYGDPETLRPTLQRICAWPGHLFWSDELSLLNTTDFPIFPSSKHLTDVFLLALAVRHQGKLATLDRRIDPALLPGGPQAYFVIP